jgi:hypothetical protein
LRAAAAISGDFENLILWTILAQFWTTFLDNLEQFGTKFLWWLFFFFYFPDGAGKGGVGRTILWGMIWANLIFFWVAEIFWVFKNWP